MTEAPPAKKNLRSQDDHKAQRLHSGDMAKGPNARSNFKDPGEAGKEETSPRELR